MNNKELKSLEYQRKIQCGIIISLAILSILGTNDFKSTTRASEADMSAPVDIENNTVEDLIQVNNPITLETVIENAPEVENETIVIDSHDIPISSCVSVESYQSSIDVDSLFASYTNPPEMGFDWKNKRHVINCMWNFLVEQNHTDPILASAIIGNACMEGDFGLRQGTVSNQFTSIQDCRNKLGSGASCGYGIIQWTFSTRRFTLLEFYEDAYSKLSDKEQFTEEDWTKVMLSAECKYLLEEMRANEMLAAYEQLPPCENVDKMIESTTGLLCRNFISYSGNSTQWSNQNGTYKLVANYGSGRDRLDYAINIYHFYVHDN